MFDVNDLVGKVVVGDSLVEELRNLPSLILEWGNKLAQAQTEVMKIKLKLKVLEGSKDLEVRRSPGLYGLDKITESAVQSAVASCPDVRALQEELIKAEEEETFCKAVLDSLYVKKDVLGGLITLKTGGI